MKYLHYYKLETQFDEDYYGERYLEPWTSLIAENDRVDYNKVYGYLRFDVLSNGYINWLSSEGDIVRTVEYRKNNGKWQPITSSTEGARINVETGDVVEFRGDNRQYAEVKDREYIYPETGILDIYNNNNIRSVSFSGTTCQVNLGGNIMSMIYKDAFPNKTTLLGECNFYNMFNMGSVLKSIDNLVLPATDVQEGCYAYMFKGGDYTSPLALPAKTVKEACYRNIYADSKVTTVPVLGALNTAKYAFSGMLARTKVASVPSNYLSFTTDLSLGCYDSMFRGCSELTNFPALPATSVPQKAYNQMFENCYKLTSAPELPATTLGESCYYAMFGSCTGLTTAPDLPATTLSKACYQWMFRHCTNLNYVKCLATDISAESCSLDWLLNTSATGTFVKAASMTSWPRDASGIPAGWTVVDE